METEKEITNEPAEIDSTGELLIDQIMQFDRARNEDFQETVLSLREFVHKIDENFTPEARRQIFDAVLLMFTLHINQKDRPDGQPYVSHPLAVAQQVADMASKPDKDLVIAALMHDAVEDQSDQLSSLSGVEDRGTGIEEGSLAEIKTKYGERTANIVSHLSNPDFTMALESQGISKKDPRYQEFKNKLYADHVQEIVEDPDVLTIKLADFSENALSLDALPVETDRQKLQKQKFLDKYTPVMKIFIDRLQRDNLFPVYQQKLLEKYNQYTQN